MKNLAIHIVQLILFCLIVCSCKKETIEPELDTSLSIGIQSSLINNISYRVSKVDVTSADDNVLSNALLHIHARSYGNDFSHDSIIFTGTWREAQNLSFSLSRRTDYYIFSYLIDNITSDTLDFESNSIDNIKYPSHVKIWNVTADMVPDNYFYELNGDGLKWIQNFYIHTNTSYFVRETDFEEKIVRMLDVDLDENTYVYDPDSVYLPTHDYHGRLKQDSRYNWLYYYIGFRYNYRENYNQEFDTWTVNTYDIFEWALDVESLIENSADLSTEPKTIQLISEGDNRAWGSHLVYSDFVIQFTYQFVYE